MAADRETSIRRGIEVLLALGSEDVINQGGLGVTRIAESLGREKSQVSRTLKILTHFGLVDRDPDTLAYRLGWRIFALAHLAGERRLLDEAQPLVERLVATLSERAHLSVLQGADALTILSESPRHAIQAVGWVGRVVPAYCTSAGRVLLLDYTRDDLERLFESVEFKRLAPNTVRNVSQLADRIAEARELGYAVADEEFEPGLVAVAAPVRGPQGRVVAALNVSGPSYRFGQGLDRAGVELKAAGRELSAALGAPAEQPVAISGRN